jgi:hypothetical protein
MLISIQVKSWMAANEVAWTCATRVKMRQPSARTNKGPQDGIVYTKIADEPALRSSSGQDRTCSSVRDSLSAVRAHTRSAGSMVRWKQKQQKKWCALNDEASTDVFMAGG